MVRVRLRGLVGVVPTALLLTQVPVRNAAPLAAGIEAPRIAVGGWPAASAPSPSSWIIRVASTLSPQEWLDTIRVPLRDEGPEVKCPGVGAIAFDPQSAQPSAAGRRSLDALNAALTSPDLADSRFRILWLAHAGEDGSLAEQRASVVAADLHSQPALPAARLTMQPASSPFEDCAEPVPANALLLQVKIAGRWWGEQ